MPKVIGQTPGWLSLPSAGGRIFSDPSNLSPASPNKRASALNAPPDAEDYFGPRRLIAHRGTEIFTAVGNKIRWADLVKVKDDWEEKNYSPARRNKQTSSDEDADGEKPVYRTLSTPVFYQIRQLVISPSGYFLAICTEHTIHIAVLPDSSRLSEHDLSPIKLKTYQLGPTTHVIPESPLASVLWHPLAFSSPSTDCLVTVTAEAAVRVWELDRSNRWSFERPALAIDLRKLADGLSCDDDFTPSGFGKNKGFSVDDFDMEAAAARFGGQGTDDEEPWASMTLWTAMKNGDIYALCPLLPDKWQPSATTIPALTTAAVSQQAICSAEDVDSDDRQAANQQYAWVQELDRDDPVAFDGLHGQVPETRHRPQNPSAIPRLQGPFDIGLDDEQDFEVTDLFVFPARLDEFDLYSGEDDYDAATNALTAPSFTTILLGCSDDNVHIALDLEGVSGQWLPQRSRNSFSLPVSDTKDLTFVTTIQINEPSQDHFVTFTPDPLHPFSVFSASSGIVKYLSIESWINLISESLSTENETADRLQTRLETTCEGPLYLLEDILAVQRSQLSSPIVAIAPEVGYLLLTTSSSASNDTAHARFLNQPHPTAVNPLAASQFNASFRQTLLAPPQEPQSIPMRPTYQPSQIFYLPPSQPLSRLRQQLPPQSRSILVQQPMRLSPAMLDLMAAAHRTISTQTAALEVAAAELFRRCGRLREEIGQQMLSMVELAERLQNLRNVDGGNEQVLEDDKTKSQQCDERMANAKSRQADLAKRYDLLRRKMGKVGPRGRALNVKETVWQREIEEIADNVGIEVDEQVNDQGGKRSGETEDEGLTGRYEMVKDLAQSLLSEAQALLKQIGTEDMQQSQSSSQRQDQNSKHLSLSERSNPPSLQRSDSSASRRSAFGGSSGLVSSRYQRERIAEVMKMVEREGAVIDAVMGRLENLQTKAGE